MSFFIFFIARWSYDFDVHLVLPKTIDTLPQAETIRSNSFQSDHSTFVFAFQEETLLPEKMGLKPSLTP